MKRGTIKESKSSPETCVKARQEWKRYQELKALARHVKTQQEGQPTAEQQAELQASPVSTSSSLTT
jgi:hypothetical protein